MNNNLVSRTYRLPKDLYSALAKWSRRHRVNMSDVIRQAVAERIGQPVLKPYRKRRSTKQKGEHALPHQEGGRRNRV